MYCPSCGSEIPDNVNFCNFCGERVDHPQDQPIQPVIQPTQPIQGDPIPTSTPYKRNNKATGDKRNDILVFGSWPGFYYDRIIVSENILHR